MFKLYAMLGMGMALAGAVAYHFFTINSLEGQVAELELQALRDTVIISEYKEAQANNLQQIATIEAHSKEQDQEISEYMVANNRLVEQRDRYLKIFSDHNLSRLARAKPNLIEKRLNSGTASVFRSIEEDSKAISIFPERRANDDN